jgi:signal transduction histidine kinase/ActR/RegA family two-component response regulator
VAAVLVQTKVARTDELRARQVAAVYSNATPGTMATLIAGSLLPGVLFFLDAVSWRNVAIFVAIVVTHTSARLLLFRAYRRSKPQVADWRLWARWATMTATVGGLVWGFGSLLLMDYSRPELQLIVLLFCAGLTAGSITAFGTYLAAYYCNALCIMVPTTVWALVQGDTLHITYAGLAVIWTAAILVAASRYSQALTESLRLQFENLDLANDLRRQKELAEEANVAKSRFLASASHDLRQPVHALSMFVGALRERDVDAESHRLVRQIEGSVNALDGLFTSILDISRLDAGVIQVRLSAVPIGPLLERVCREEAPEAQRKNIDLQLVRCSANVDSDPILLERIVRNLIANAVRYTDQGRVLVGCRHGARLSVEVWDTGCGFSPDQHDLIFQEFYQVGNAERDRRRGLGLGLAIVRRLTRMLGIPITLSSEPGRGSAFRLSLPLARPDQLVVARSTDLGSPALVGRFILVVDDEMVIQDAMTALLTAWGHTVVVAGSGDEMMQRVVDCRKCPDLIICDYRLRRGENGIDAVQRLRAEFNDDIPAILITGDTAPDRLREASASDCLLIHKPVSNGRLRAAITHLTMAHRAAEELE